MRQQSASVAVHRAELKNECPSNPTFTYCAHFANTSNPATSYMFPAIYFQGLSPQYPGLYQINVTIPLTVDINLAVPLAIQTTNGFTDLVTMAIQ